jgi:hypothetical protein
VGNFSSVFKGKEGNTRKLAQPKLKKHLRGCFALGAGFRVALQISAFGEVGVWLGLWLIS